MFFGHVGVSQGLVESGNMENKGFGWVSASPLM
jgi:hypothetical protein